MNDHSAAAAAAALSHREIPRELVSTEINANVKDGILFKVTKMSNFNSVFGHPAVIRGALIMDDNVIETMIDG